MEVLKLIVSALTPLTVAVVGFFLNQRLKRIDDAQWQSRKIVEKRLDLYDKIAPDLNAIYCFMMWIGYWKEISPAEVIQTKRRLDKVVNIYRHLLSEEFYTAYNAFIHLCFQTYSGKGHDARIRSKIDSHWGDRRAASEKWDDTWTPLFLPDAEPERADLQAAYFAATDRLRACIGI